MAVPGLKVALQALTLLIKPSLTPSISSQAASAASYSVLRLAQLGLSAGLGQLACDAAKLQVKRSGIPRGVQHDRTVKVLRPVLHCKQRLTSAG